MPGHVRLATPDPGFPLLRPATIAIVAFVLLKNPSDGSYLSFLAAFETSPGPGWILAMLAGVLLTGSLVENDSNRRQLVRSQRPFLSRLAPVTADHDLDDTLKVTSFHRITRIIKEESLDTIYQPIVDLSSAEVVGAEALTRFRSENHRSPDSVFREAKAVGLGAELEILAIRLALDSVDELPGEMHVSLNASPDTLLHPELYDLLSDNPESNRLVIELTEHAQVTDYEPLLETLRRMRAIGVRFAVDDMGSGFANLRHVIRLDPDIIKLDIGLTRNVDRDTVSQAMALALVSFGRETRTTIVAEGIETEAELKTLRQLGVNWGQGYFLARPGQLPLRRIELLPSTTDQDASNVHALANSPGENRVWSLDQYEQLTREAERANPRRVPMAYVVGALTLATVAGMYFLRPDQFPAGMSSAIVATCALMAATVSLRGMISSGLRNRAPWFWFGIASLSWSAAAIYLMAEQTFLNYGWYYPSPAHLGMIAFFPLFTIGLVMVSNQGLAQSRLRDVVADGLIVLTFVVILIIEWLALPAEITANAPTNALLTSTGLMAFAMPMFFLAPLALVWQRQLLRSGPIALLLAGAASVSLGTLLFSRMALEGTYRLNHPIEFAWIAGFALMIAGTFAMQQQSSTGTGRPVSSSERKFPAMQIVVPGIAVIAFAGLALLGAFSIQPNWLIASGIVFTSIILAIRLASASIIVERLSWRIHERDRMESVLEASVTIANTNDIDSLLQRVAEVSANATRSERAQIRVYGNDRSQIQALGEFGLTSSERAIASRLASVPLGLIPGERQAIDSLMPKVQRSDDSQLLPEVQGLLQACGKDVTLISPLIADRNVLGVIETWSPGGARAFEPVDLAAMAVIGQEAGIAIRNTQLLKELQWRANHDGLTGLLNHRSAVEALEKSLESAAEHDQPLSVLIVDINNFKHINDSFGHLMGDQVLITLARSLTGCLRPNETAGRYGGDEFLVILPNRDSSQAESLARHFSGMANVLVNESSNIDVQVSFGIASFPTDGETTMELIALADSRMYQSKLKKHLADAADPPRTLSAD